MTQQLDVSSTLADVFPLLARPLTAVLTTQCADGRLQCTPVWFEVSGGDVLLSTMREFAKARNLRARPAATLLVVDPDDSADWVEVRAAVAMNGDQPLDVLDEISERYTGRRPYFGGVVPAELAAEEHPITCRLSPIAVTTQPVRSGPAKRMARPPQLPAPVGCGDEVPLPADHLDLLDAPFVAAFATRLPDGSAQTQPVWFLRDGNDLLVNTTLERRKGRDLVADPRATLLVVDPRDSNRWVEVRADVDLSTDDAEAQLDAVTRHYTPHEHFYGGVYPVAQRARETRVIARLHPRVVHCDAVHR